MAGGRDPPVGGGNGARVAGLRQRAADVAHRAAGEVHGAQREGIGDVERAVRRRDAAGQAECAARHPAHVTAGGVDRVDRVVGHVGDVEAVRGIESEVVEIRRCLRHALAPVRGDVDAEDLAGFVVDREQLAA